MDVTVRLDSVLASRDGSHFLVSATLPDGRVLRDVETPTFGSRDALAAYIAQSDAGYHTIPGFTGNVKIEVANDWPAKAPVAEEAPATDTPPATDPNAGQGEQTPPADTPPATPPAADSTPKAIGVKDGGKGKSKGE